MIKYTIKGQCRKLDDVPKGATITEINGRSVLGRCESCGVYITESCKGIKCHVWADGVITCADCK